MGEAFEGAGEVWRGAGEGKMFSRCSLDQREVVGAAFAVSLNATKFLPAHVNATATCFPLSACFHLCSEERISPGRFKICCWSFGLSPALPILPVRSNLTISEARFVDAVSFKTTCSLPLNDK